MNFIQILTLLAACICFTGCYEIMEGALEGTNSYLDAQIAAQRTRIAVEREQRKQTLEDLEISLKVLQIRLEVAEARLEARRVAALEKLVESKVESEARRVDMTEKLIDSMVYVNEARKYHHPDCHILTVSTVKVMAELTVAKTIYSPCAQCVQ